MLTKEIKSTATVAWSPASSQSTRLVTGTLAGAMDASFSTSAELDIHEISLGESEAKKLGSISSNSRFNRLAWSAHNAASSDGVIIGGMEDGSIGFWNASKIISKASSADCQIDLKMAHQGPVKGLQVNPMSPHLLASGSINADILLWDLNGLQSYPPTGQKSARLEDVSDLAWNCQVPHILASSSVNGYTVIWDLKSRKEVIQLCLPGGRKNVSSIAWNPETPTHLLTATDDDQSPVIYSWDLRNSHAPNMTFTGHSKGVLSLSWCPKDSELLLSSGKDGKTLCWNPSSGQLVNEVTQNSNWIFDTQWCPRNPDIFASASFDGSVRVHSFQALSSGHAAGHVAMGGDVFGGQAHGTPVVATGDKARQIPKWLRRPIGASFGFGGRLVSFTDKRVTISSVGRLDIKTGISESSLQLDEALRTGDLGGFCGAKLKGRKPVQNLHESEPEAVFWNVVKVMVGQEPQKELLNLLGFDREKFEAQLKSLNLKGIEESLSQMHIEGPTSGKVSRASTASEHSPIDFGGSEESSVFDQISTEAPAGLPARLTRTSSTFALFGPEADPTDKCITQAIIMGDFNVAVDVCIQSGRLSDALLVAICGGPELLAKTQEIYLQRVKNPYLRLVGAIIKKDLTDVIENASVANWEELLGLICSFAGANDFERMCGILAERLEQEQGGKSYLAAIICWMAAGRAADAARILLEHEKAPSTYEYVKYGGWLGGLVEKLRGLERASKGSVDLANAVPDVGRRFLEYAALMASQGSLDIASRYVSAGVVGSSDINASFGDRIYEAAVKLNPTLPKVPAPFEPVNVQAEASAMPAASAQPLQQQQFNQPGYQTQSYVPAPSAPAPNPPGHQEFSSWNPPAPAAPAQPAGPMPMMSPTSTGSFNSAAAAPFPPAPFANGPASFPTPQPFAPQPGSFQPFAPQPGAFQQASPTGMIGQPGQMPPPKGPYAAAPMAPTAPAAFTAPVAPMAPPKGPYAAAPSAAPAFPGAPPAVPAPSPFAAAAAPGQPATQPYGMPPAGMPQEQHGMQPQLPRAPSFGQQPGFGAASPTGPQPPHAAAAPYIPQPSPVPSPSLQPTPSLEQIRRPTGGFNDAPLISPKQPMGPSAVAHAPMFTPQAAAPMAHHPNLGGPNLSSPVGPPAAPSASMPGPAPTSPRLSQLGPVDQNRIPPGSLPVYQAFSALIGFCQQRALPVQRRILEDSVKRLQFLFHQLAGDAQPALSPPVLQEMLRMADLIDQRQYDAALDLHVPLMTAHFTEVGQWILAVKRLVEVAKTCPPQ